MGICACTLFSWCLLASLFRNIFIWSCSRLCVRVRKTFVPMFVRAFVFKFTFVSLVFVHARPCASLLALCLFSSQLYLRISAIALSIISSCFLLCPRHGIVPINRSLHLFPLPSIPLKFQRHLSALVSRVIQRIVCRLDQLS